MNQWRCQCGKTQYMESGQPPADCAGCDVCGTRLSASGGPFEPRAHHTPVTRYSAETGAPAYILCALCFEVLKRFQR